jgi:hypothetical protein
MKKLPLLSLILVLFAAAVFAAEKPAEQTVTVTGAVSKPGNYPLLAGQTLADLLSKAGGPAMDANLHILLKWQVLSGPTRQLSAGLLTVRPRQISRSSWSSGAWVMKNVYDMQNPKDFKLKPGDEILVFKTGPSKDKMVTRYFRDVPFTEAVDSILKDSGYGYSIDPSVAAQNLKVTASLKNAPVEIALNRIAQAAGTRLDISDGVVVIGPSESSYPPAAAGMMYGANTAGARSAADISADRAPVAGTQVKKGLQAQTPPARSETVDLSYVQAGDILPLLSNVEGVQVARSSGQSRVVITAPDSALQEAKKAIEGLDTQDAWPRPVRIGMVATVTLGDLRYSCTTEAHTADGSPAPMNMSASDIDLGNGQKGQLDLQAVATPVLMRSAVDGKDISLTGNGVISGSVPVQFKQQFTFSASLAGGMSPAKGGGRGYRDQQVIASGSVNAGGTDVGFEVTAGASVEAGRVVSQAGGYAAQQQAAMAGAQVMRSPQYDVNFALKNAEALVKEGKLDEALSQLLQARKAVPTCAEVHNQIGNILVKMGKFEEAIQSYEKATNLDPDVPAYKTNLEDAAKRNAGGSK